MLQINMDKKIVLITGGTKGIGFATALKFAEAGAKCYLTFKWDDEDFSNVYQAFKDIKAKEPTLIQADVAINEDTDNLLNQIAGNEDKIDIFISNVGFGQRTMSLEEYKKKSFFKTLEYSSWPLIEYTKRIKKVFGKYPKYIVGISSDGPDHFYTGYDFIAASKALLEFFAKYLSVHLFSEGSRVNIIRFGPVKTESFTFIFGEEFFQFLKDQGFPEEMIMKPEECGDTIVGLCSGFFDAINGQIITADKGLPFRDNTMMRYLSTKK